MSVHNSLFNCSIGQAPFPLREMQKSVDSRTASNLLNNCSRVKEIPLEELDPLAVKVNQNYIATFSRNKEEKQIVALWSTSHGHRIWEKEIEGAPFKIKGLEFDLGETGAVTLIGSEKKRTWIYEGEKILPSNHKTDQFVSVKILNDRILACFCEKISNDEPKTFKNVLEEWDFKGNLLESYDLEIGGKPYSNYIACNKNYWVYLSETSKSVEVIDRVFKTHTTFELPNGIYSKSASSPCIINNELIFDQIVYDSNFYYSVINVFDLSKGELTYTFKMDENDYLIYLSRIESSVSNERFSVWISEKWDNIVGNINEIKYLDLESKEVIHVRTTHGLSENAFDDLNIFGSTLSIIEYRAEGNSEHLYRSAWDLSAGFFKAGTDYNYRQQEFSMDINQGIFCLYKPEKLLIENFIESEMN